MSTYPYRLATLSKPGCPPFPALVKDEHAIALRALRPLALQLGYPLVGVDDMAALLGHWAVNQPALQQVAQHLDVATHPLATPVSALRMESPVQPTQVFCTIGNYRAQVIEATVDAHLAKGGSQHEVEQVRAQAEAFVEARRQGEPYICLKAPACVAGPHDPLYLGVEAGQVDWEVELAVVIGTSAYQISEADALAHVAGYTVANDITHRDRVFRAAPAGFGTDWLQSKCSEGFLPLGPYLLPASLVPTPAELRLQLSVNGTAMQDDYCADMIFGIARQVAYISQHVRLLPGDVICTGSPAGFGVHHQRFLRDGDCVTASIEGFGHQQVSVHQANTVAASSRNV